MSMYYDVFTMFELFIIQLYNLLLYIYIRSKLIEKLRCFSDSDNFCI